MNYKKLFATFEASFEADAEDGQMLSEYIAERFEEVKDTQGRLNKLGQERKEEEDKHRLAIAKLDKEVRDVQASCTHPLTTYHPDASGNNDSHTECNICDLEVARHGVRGYDG